MLTEQDFLPIPEKSLKGTMPFNPQEGDTRTESNLKRALLALPFLVICFFVSFAMDPTIMIPQLIATVKKGTVNWETGSVPIQFRFYHIKALDDL